jgi:ABC-type polysaccharide/polyol phosphate transport system ATPase subunit
MNSSQDIVVDVRKLTKTYNLYKKPFDRLKETFNPFGTEYHTTVNALNNISFSVQRRDIIGIIGKNGSGKSTLLKIIVGVLTPTSGEILIGGRISSILELGTGFNPEFTGTENIFHVGMIMGYSKEQIEKKYQFIQSFADIGDFIDQPVKIYSSGMYVRLAFAIAINVDPDILIVDEALAVGDINFQAKCISKFKQLVDHGVTVLLVTHDTNTVKSLCNKCLYLKYGEMVAFGPAQEVTDLYLHDMRDEMNLQLQGQGVQKERPSASTIIPSESKNTPHFCENRQFEKRISLFRQGTGEVEIVNAEMFDSSGMPVSSIEFDEQVIIRTHIRFKNDAHIAVCYHIRDSKGIEIIGSDTYVENCGSISGKKGQKFIIDFITKLPLIEGDYNLLILLSDPVITNRSAIFVDWAENAYSFKVMQRQPVKIWDKVYLKNDLKIYSIE